MHKSYRSEASPDNSGLSRQVWETGLQRVMAAALRSQPNVEQALLLAYGKLYWPATDLPLCKQQLEELASEVSANASNAASETNWLRLSGILSHFAPRC
jgi:hypothetical protein